MAGSGHCTLVLFQRGVKHRNGLSSGIQLSGQKGGFQSRDPADHQADFLSAGPCLFRADHGGNVPDRRDAGARYLDPVLYYTFAASVLALGLGYFTASVNVFFKDMAQIVGICLQFGIWLSPIMYHESMFTDRMPWMEPIFKLNPFYYIVTGYKDSMITGNWFWERPKLTLYYWAFTLIVLLCGLKMFKKLRPHFSDVL